MYVVGKHRHFVAKEPNLRVADSEVMRVYGAAFVNPLIASLDALRASNEARVVAQARRGVSVLVLDGLPDLRLEVEQLPFDSVTCHRHLPHQR